MACAADLRSPYVTAFVERMVLATLYIPGNFRSYTIFAVAAVTGIVPFAGGGKQYSYCSYK